jgi:peptidyl-prolyl cis-trans isomerase A (cyclophilin A)
MKFYKFLAVFIILILLITPLVNSDYTGKGSSINYNNPDEEFVTEMNATKIVVLETNWGEIKFELYEELAPITTANFIKLAEDNFYDGIKFHRIIDDFVIQTGDPNTRDNNPYNDGSGGSSETIPLEIHQDLTHIDGAVGMARGADPDSASSQFYICDGPQHGLDGDYAVFGITVEGFDVVRQIAQAETYPEYRVLLKDHPVDDIIMEKVNIEVIINATINFSGEMEKPNDDKGLPGFEASFTIIAVAAAVIFFSKKKSYKSP